MFCSRKIAILVALILLSSMVLSACSPAATPAPAPTAAAAVQATMAPQATEAPQATVAPQATAGTQPTVTVPITTPMASSAKYGGTLRQVYIAPTNLDPAALTSISDDEIARNWGDFLVYTDENYRPDPNRSLAQSWTTSSDGLTWTFNLRQGVVFNNGQPFTSKDVKFTFGRLMDPKIGAATAPTYANITNIATPDDHTVVFTLAKPNPDLPLDLGDYHSIIVWSGTTDFETQHIGTGPFIIASYTPEDRMVFKRNPNYWMKDADGNQLPYLDGMQFIFNSDPSAQVEALRGGQADYLLYFPAEFAKTIQSDPNLYLITKPSNTTYVIRMRVDHAPFNNPLVVQAFKAAVDRNAILQTAYGGLGVTGRDTPIGPGYADYYLNVPEPQRDVAKAKQLLAQAGYPNGLKVTLTAQSISPVPAMATILQAQLKDAGIEADIQQMPSDVYYGSGNPWLTVDFAITDWGARAYPQPYLDLAYECGAEWNETHWCDKQLDTLAKQAAVEQDHAKRADLYKQIQQIFIDRGPIIVPFFGDNLWAASKKLQGLVPTSYLGTALDLRQAYFTK
jgi:peptide/nickel transport system substrate-binding protein